MASRLDHCRKTNGKNRASATRDEILRDSRKVRVDFRAALGPVLLPLIKQNRWLIWRYHDERKVPYQAKRPDAHASCNDPETWASFAESVKALGRADGLGFALRG